MKRVLADRLISARLGEGKQVGKLYHFTSEDGAMGVLSGDFNMQAHAINTHKQFQGYTGERMIWGVSFTRSPKPLYTLGLAKMAVRITVDGDKLSNKYKIMPVAELGYRGRGLGYGGAPEFEELVITGKQGLRLDSGNVLEVAYNRERLEKAIDVPLERYPHVIDHLSSLDYSSEGGDMKVFDPNTGKTGGRWEFGGVIGKMIDEYREVYGEDAY